MRLKLYAEAIRTKAQKKARRNSRMSPTPQDEPTNADAEADTPISSKVPPIQAVPVNMVSLISLA